MNIIAQGELKYHKGVYVRCKFPLPVLFSDSDWQHIT